MKYSFHPKKLSNWKGAIAESLARHYINDVTIPRLKKEFDFVFMEFISHGRFSEFLPLSFIDSALLMGEKINWEKAWKEANVKFEMYKSGKKIPITEERLKLYKEQWKKEHIENATLLIPRKVLKIFWERCTFPDSDLFDKTIKLLSFLEVATDGIIFKLNKTGADLGSFNYIKALSKWNLEIFEELRAPIPPKEIPVVSGETEIIEIKADKAFIMPHQAENYKKILTEGYSLRYFHVDFISFESNQFEIEEKLIKKPTELENISRRLKK